MGDDYNPNEVTGEQTELEFPDQPRRKSFARKTLEHIAVAAIGLGSIKERLAIAAITSLVADIWDRFKQKDKRSATAKKLNF